MHDSAPRVVGPEGVENHSGNDAIREPVVAAVGPWGRGRYQAHQIRVRIPIGRILQLAHRLFV